MLFPTRVAGEFGSDIGTLWRMERAHDVDHCAVARCALWSRADRWELRVLIDGVVQCAERCDRGYAAFALAEEWKRHMSSEGWRQIVPPERQPTRSARRVRRVLVTARS